MMNANQLNIRPEASFKTPDPALCGYLLSLGFEPISLERAGPQFQFVFPLTSAIKQAVADYGLNARTPVRDVIGGYRRALHMIRNARNDFKNSGVQGANEHVTHH
jgi:hypothetical protein